ncbi:MAG: radical SAM protein [candidate division WOR-3 bacterium]|nr:radical SAM protein [candidate division WOR-3 bacterium]
MNLSVVPYLNLFVILTKLIHLVLLFYKGRTLIVREFLYLHRKGGIKTILSCLQLFRTALKNEKINQFGGKAVLFFLVPPIPSEGFKRHLRHYSNKFILKNNKSFFGQAFIAVNRKCPFNCWYCSSGNTLDNELSLKELDKIITISKDWGASTIVFTGGEPLLRDDIDTLISKYAKDLSFVILTSGYGLTLERAKKLKDNGLFSISISLDHYDRRINDQARGKEGAFDIALDAIKNAKGAGIYTVVQTVATSELLQNGVIQRFINFVKSLNVDELFLLEPLCTGRLFDKEKDFYLNDSEIETLKLLHAQSAKEKNGLKIITSPFIEDTSKFGCGAGTQHIYVDTSGELWPCNFLPVSLGNILKESETVKQRLKKYFSCPSAFCILKKYHKEFLKCYNNGLPIKFEMAEKILKKVATGKETFSYH